MYHLPTYTRQKAAGLNALAGLEVLLLGHALAQIVTTYALLGRHLSLPATRAPWLPHPLWAAGPALLLLALGALRVPHKLLRRPFLVLALFGQVLALAYPAFALRSLIRFWRLAPAGGSSLPPLGSALFALVALRAGILLFEHSRLRRFGQTQGSAHFGSVAEARAAQLALEPPGLPLGRLGRETLYLPAELDIHVLAIAASGAGKSTSFVIPGILSALRAGHSAIVFDIKGELWEATAGFASTTHRVYRWSPSELASPHRYNPLSLIPKGFGDVEAAQVVAENLCNPDGHQKGADFWVASARSLITAAILHQLYTHKRPNLTDIWRTLNPPAGNVVKLFQKYAQTPHDPELRHGFRLDGLPTAVHPVVAAEFANFCALAQETSGGILKTALSFLDLFADPILGITTAVSDFHPLDLQLPSVPPAILYLHIPADQIERTRNLLRLAIRQNLSHLLADPRPGGERRPLHIFLDELPQLGPFPYLERAIAVTRSYRIFFRLAVQTIGQLRALYGQNESISPNCRALQVFGIADYPTADHFSRMLGNATLHVERLTQSSQARGGGGSSTSTQDVGRPLLTADEFRRLPPALAVLLINGVPPFLLERIPCFEHPEFSAWMRMPAPGLPPAQTM